MADAPEKSVPEPVGESPVSSSTAESALEPATETLGDLLREFGHLTGRTLTDWGAMATAVQAQRVVAGDSRAEGITRSSALWAAMAVDPALADSLHSAGLDQDALAGALSVRATPSPARTDRVLLHDELVQALGRYLAGRSGLPPIEAADIAVATLESARRDRSGALARALGHLGVDLDQVLAAADATTPRERPSPFDPSDFSATVIRARDSVGGSTTIAPADLARTVQSAHPEYGDGTFADVRWTSSEMEGATTDEWLAGVHGLYDMDSVRSSGQDVIDGRMLLLGLAELDPSLALDLSAGDFLTKLREETEVKPRRLTMDHTDWTPDAPARDDLLGRRRLAEALAQRLRLLASPTRRASQSFIVHVDGPWGAGKSTLFEFLDDELSHRTTAHDDRARNPRFLVVRVNAWREQRVGVQWWTLLAALRRAISQDAPWFKRPWLWVHTFLDRVRAGWVPFVAAALVLIGTVVWVAALSGFDLSLSAAAAESVTKVVGAASVAFGGLVAATRFLLPGSRRSAQGFLESSDNPMEELGRLFARTLRRSPVPVVFLIDDLDRCDGDYVVRFLEAIQTLVRDAPQYDPRPHRWWRRGETREWVAGPYAFVAADGQWIRTSYEDHYRSFLGTGGPGRPLGYLFLEKVFQLQVRLPAITETAKAAYLSSLLRRGSTGRAASEEQVRLAATARDSAREARSEKELIDAAAQATRITDHQTRMEILGDVAVRFSEREVETRVEHALARFGAYLEPNPRTMLLFVNAYGVLRQLRTLEEVLVATEPLALWAVVGIRWPYLADYLRRHPDAVVAPTPDDVPEDVRVLLASADVQDVLNDRKSRTPSVLTPDLIRQCAGTAS